MIAPPVYNIQDIANSPKIETAISYNDFDETFLNNSTFLINILKNNIENSFNDEINKVTLFSKSTVEKAFYDVIYNFAVINPSHSGVEIASDNSLFIYAKLNDFKIHFELLSDDDIENSYNMVALNVFDKTSHVLSKLVDISDAFKHIRSLLSNNSNYNSLVNTEISQNLNAYLSKRNTTKSELFNYPY